MGTVTGSKYLLEHNDRRVLVDCGLFQGGRELRERNWQDPAFDVDSLDAVIITHAHIDHTGFLPRLVKLGYRGPVFTSRATADLLKILLPDSGRLQEEDADYRNRNQLTRHAPALPLYDENDANEALKLLQPVPNNGVAVVVCENFRASFQVAGHIIGASLVLVEMHTGGNPSSSEGAQDSTSSTERTLPTGRVSASGAIRFLFSGDLGHYDQPIVKDPAVPSDCDYLMVESTYGNRLHGEVDSATQMARIINQAAERNAADPHPRFRCRTNAGSALSDPRARGRKTNSGLAGRGRFADGGAIDAGLQPVARRAR